MRPSPVVALNRAIAVAQSEGPARGLEEMKAIDSLDRLADYPFYHTALGELENRLGHDAKARTHLQTAFALARNPMEQRFLQQRLEASARRSVGRQP